MNTETTKKLQFTSPRAWVIVALLFALVATTFKADWSPIDSLTQAASGGSATGGGTIDVPAQAGDRFDVEIQVADAEALAAFEATLRTTPPGAALPISIRLGDIAPAGSTLLQGNALAGEGLAIGGYNATGQTATGSGDLVIVTFEAVADGELGFSLDPATTAAFDAIGQPLPAKVSLRMPNGPVYLPSLANGAE